ncbi:MAG: hypothetical protein IT428_29120 [Planctomycetaceae bacterium]|nr:hypothetical protein [Planctomycetaceae bacterium]
MLDAAEEQRLLGVARRMKDDPSRPEIERALGALILELHKDTQELLAEKSRLQVEYERLLAERQSLISGSP